MVPITELLPGGALGRWINPLFSAAGRIVSSEPRGPLRAAGVELIAHHALTKLRAIELGLPLIRASSTGISSLVDAQGRTHAISRSAERVVLSGTLPVGNSTVLYRRFGDGPILAILLAILIVRLLPKLKSASEHAP